MSASGIVRDETGSEIARFSTSHNGMGKVSFIPEQGKTYSAEYTGPEGQIRTAEIGAPKQGAASLRYVSSRSRSVFSVAGGKGMNLELIIARRGKGLIATPISAEQPISIDTAELPAWL